MRWKSPKSQSGDYKVGKGRPPQSTRWKPGQSGNPKGRPKGSRPVGAVLQDIIQQKVSVTESGKTRRFSTLEVIIRQLANDAMRSDSRAIKLLLSLLDRYGESPAAKVALGEMLAEDREILTQYLREPDSPIPDRLPKPDEEDRDDND